MKRFAFLFPGQGAQYPGMGKEFYDNFSIAYQTFEEADDLLEYQLSKVIFSGPSEMLTLTKNSQTAIFVTSVAILRVLQQECPQLAPRICSGLSLGEYTALFAAQKISFSDGLQLVAKRSQFMNDACEKKGGEMAVVLGLEGAVVADLVSEAALPNDLWVANFNCPGQVVISGTSKGVERGMELAKQCGAKRILPLAVHGAFHSGLMREAKERLEPFIQQAPLCESAIDFVMNVPGDFVFEMDRIRSYLTEQVTHSVKWEQGIRCMAPKIDHFVELGCGKTLAGFNKRIGVGAPTSSVETVANLKELLQSV